MSLTAEDAETPLEAAPAEELEPVEVPDSTEEDSTGEEAEGTPEDEEFEEVPPDTLSQTYTVKVDGEELEVSLDEALKGYMRQAAFTQKTQALSQEREQAAAMQRLETALVQDFPGTVQAMAQALGVDATQLFSQAGASDLDDPPEPWEAELAEMRAWREGEQARSREEQINTALAEVKTQYPDLDEAVVLKFAIDNRVTDLHVAADALATRLAAEQAAETKETVIRRKRQARVVDTSGVSTQTTQSGKAEKMTFRERLEAELPAVIPL